LEIEKSIWEGRIRIHTSMKGLRPCNRTKEEVHAKKKKGIFIIKRGVGESTSICKGSTI